MLADRYFVLIEDDAIMGYSITQRLELEGAKVTWVKQAIRGVSAVRTPSRPVDGVICDIRLPDGTGEDIFIEVSRSITPPPFLFITGQGEIDQAVRLLRAGAADYMTKPFDMPFFLSRLALILRPELPDGLPPQLGISPLARQIDALILDFAKNDRPVLIRGQQGLGKAHIARRIHDFSDRAAAPFIAVNAYREASLDDKLTEATAAVGDGTLFINGVERLNAASQDRLMAILGSAPFRLVVSSGTQGEEKTDDGKGQNGKGQDGMGGDDILHSELRPDLLYTLVSNEIVVPPLSQRPEDATWLAGQLFQTLNARRDEPLKGVSELAYVAIRDHDWPGNGRELRARLVRAMEAPDKDWIHPADIFPELNEGDREIQTLSQARESAERRQIIKALGQTGGQLTEAAGLLKVSRTTLWEKMQKLGL